MSRRYTLVAGLVAGAMTLLGACAPGSTTAPAKDDGKVPAAVATDPAAMGTVELVVWDQEVRGGGAAQIEKLNAAFTAKYPNITIKRSTKSFDDLVKTVRLALSGNTPPDVVQINNTRADMGTYVKAGQLTDLTPYAKTYGWDSRFSESIRRATSYTTDAKTFGSGNLYGIPQVGEVVGVYVNTKKLKALDLEFPKTMTDFEQALATAKAKGETPIMLGNLDKWPALHVFGVIQGSKVKAEEIRTLAFGNKGASWKTDGNKEALATVQSWADKGYFNDGFNGEGYDPAWQKFSQGNGLFLIGGTWLQADLSKAMGNDVAFHLPPPASAGGTSIATGASGQPWTISAKSQHKDAAAAYINFISTPEAMKLIAETENLPVYDTAKQQAPNDLAKQVFTAFDTATTKDGLVPYLDWATPTMGDTIGGVMQDLLAKKVTPDQALETIEKDYSGFVASNG